MDNSPIEVNDSTREIFQLATVNIEDVICQIQNFFYQISNNAEKPVKDPILPPLRRDDQNVKLEHWFVYREYEHVMKYATELIAIIKKHQFSE